MLRPSPRAVLAGVLSAVSLASLTAPATAQEKRPLRVDDLFALREVGDPRLSPDGAQVAFTVKSLDAKKDKSDTDVYVVDLAGGDARRLTASPKAETSPRFSPDGKIPGLPFGAGGQEDTGLADAPERRRGPEAHRLQGRRHGPLVVPRLEAAGPRRVRPDPDEIDEDEGKKTDDEEDASKTPKPIVLRRLQFKRDVRRLPAGAAGAPPRLRRREEDEIRRSRRAPTTTRTRLVAGRAVDRVREQPHPRCRTRTATPTSSWWPPRPYAVPAPLTTAPS